MPQPRRRSLCPPEEDRSSYHHEPSELARLAAAKAFVCGYVSKDRQRLVERCIDMAAEELAADEAIGPAKETP